MGSYEDEKVRLDENKMRKTKQDYLTDISNLYRELRKDTYGEKKGGNHYLPPNSNSFYVNAKKLYEEIWDYMNNYPESIDLNSYFYVHDSERIVLYELEILRKSKTKKVDLLMETLEKYFFKIGEDLHVFLQSK